MGGKLYKKKRGGGGGAINQKGTLYKKIKMEIGSIYKKGRSH